MTTETDTDIPNIIFDGKCRLKEISEAQLAGLTPERRERYEQVRAAAAVAEADELAYDNALRTERRAEDAVQSANAAYLKLSPKREFIDILREAQAAYRSQHS